MADQFCDYNYTLFEECQSFIDAIFAKKFYDDLLFKFKVSRSTIDDSFLLKVQNMAQLFCRKKRTVLKLNRPKQGVKPSNSVCST